MSSKATEISCYSNYCHQMRQLRADRNRVLLSCDAVAVSPTAAKTIRELVRAGYKGVCGYGTAVAKRFVAAVDGGDIAAANAAGKELHRFTRRVTEYCQVLEEEMVPHEDFPNGYVPNEVDPTVQFDCRHFIEKLDPATRDLLRYIRDAKARAS